MEADGGDQGEWCLVDAEGGDQGEINWLLGGVLMEATKGACYLERDMGITGNWWTGNTDEDLQTAS